MAIAIKEGVRHISPYSSAVALPRRRSGSLGESGEDHRLGWHPGHMTTGGSSKAIYLKAFLLGWLIFTAIWVFLGLLTGRPLHDVVLPATVLGGLFSAFLALTIARRFAPLQGDAPVRPRTRVFVSLPYETAFEHCSHAVRSLPGSTVERLDVGSGIIVARVARTPESWGELVIITVRAIGSDTEVSVSSRPTYRLTLVDQGKNARNVEHILASLRGSDGQAGRM
ncbi:MAG: hypothetical protein ABR540_18625 [Acidimicrobiales bacterium]